MPAPDTGKIALFIAVLAGFITPFDLSAVNIALPTIANEFSMDAISMGWVATAYLLASCIFLVPFGRIADIWGRKKIFLAGLSIFTVSSLVMIFSTSALMIIFVRVAQGMGAALIFGTAVAILTSVTPPAGRGRALGIYTTAIYLGLSMGPFIGGFLTQHFGWRSIFLINLPLGIFTIALLAWGLPGEWADARGERFDLKGAVQYALSLICVMYGFTLLPGVYGILLVLAGLVMLAIFVIRELRIPFPLLDITLFRDNRVFAFSNIAALINYSATFAITFFLSLYLQYVKGFPAGYAGTILVVQPVMQALLSTYAGRLSDRIEPGKIASAGMALTATGLLLLVTIDATTSLAFLIATLALLGIGFALFSSPNTNAIMSSVEKRNYGVASGTLGTMRLVGQMLSMGIAMMILAMVVGKVAITDALYPQLLTSMHYGFLIFFVLCVAGIFFSLVRGKVRDDRCSP